MSFRPEKKNRILFVSQSDNGTTTTSQRAISTNELVDSLIQGSYGRGSISTMLLLLMSTKNVLDDYSFECRLHFADPALDVLRLALVRPYPGSSYLSFVRSF